MCCKPQPYLTGDSQGWTLTPGHPIPTSEPPHVAAESDVASSPHAPSHQGLSEHARPTGGQKQTHSSVTQGLTLQGWDIRIPVFVLLFPP